ncbi:unnamed protein product [Caenorhabditis brenneri]
MDMEQKKSRSVQVLKKPAEPVKSPESSSPVKPVEKKKWIVPNCIYRTTRRTVDAAKRKIQQLQKEIFAGEKHIRMSFANL